MRLKKLIFQGIVWRGLFYASVFVLNVAIARIYEADVSGIINYLINNLAFLLLLTSVSLESGLAFHSSGNTIPKEKLAGIALAVSLFSALVCTVIAVKFFENSPWESSVTIALVVFSYVLGVVLTNYFSALFYSVNRIIVPNAILTGVNALVLAYALIEYAGPGTNDLRSNFLTVFLLSFGAQGLLLLISWLVTEKQGFHFSFPSAQQLKTLFRYAGTALIGNLLFFLVYRVDYWFVEYYCDADSLGNYIQVSKLGQIFLLLPTIIATPIFTRTAGGNHDEVRSAISVIARWLTVLYLVLISFIGVTGNWLFPFIYGDSFDRMYTPFLLLSPGILSLSTLALLTAFNAGRNRLPVNLKGSLAALAVIVAADLLLIPSYGIAGAAAASSLGYIAYLLYVLYHYRQEFGTLGLLPVRKMRKQKIM